MFGLNKIIPVEPNINFLGLRRNFLIFSILAMLISIVLLSIKGLNLGIDFKGGTLIEVSTKNTSIGELRETLSSSYSDVSLQEFGDKNIILITASLFFLSTLSGQLRIEIKGGLEDPINVAVVPMQWNLDSPQDLFVHEVIKSDLESFGEFYVLPPKNMLSLPSSKEEVFFKDWRILGTDFLVIGDIGLSEVENEIKVSFFIFDIVKERLIHKGVVFGTKKSLRRISHKISDIIYSKIYDIPGIFSTQIAYIDKPSASDPNYNLMISDLDGFQSLSLFSSPQPLMSPSWSPDKKKIAYVSFEEGTSRIFIQQLSNAQRFGLKLERGINSSPNWSPNGDKLSAVLSRTGNPDIFIYDLKLSTWIQVTNHFGIDTEPDWSPDSNKILFTVSSSSCLCLFNSI